MKKELRNKIVTLASSEEKLNKVINAIQHELKTNFKSKDHFSKSSPYNPKNYTRADIVEFLIGSLSFPDDVLVFMNKTFKNLTGIDSSSFSIFGGVAIPKSIINEISYKTRLTFLIGWINISIRNITLSSANVIFGDTYVYELDEKGVLTGRKTNIKRSNTVKRIGIPKISNIINPDKFKETRNIMNKLLPDTIDNQPIKPLISLYNSIVNSSDDIDENDTWNIYKANFEKEGEEKINKIVLREFENSGVYFVDPDTQIDPILLLELGGLFGRVFNYVDAKGKLISNIRILCQCLNLLILDFDNISMDCEYIDPKYSSIKTDTAI